MTDSTVPEAAVRAVQRIPGSPRGIAGLYPEEISEVLVAADPPERHAAAMARAVSRQLDTMAHELEEDANRG